MIGFFPGEITLSNRPKIARRDVRTAIYVITTCIKGDPLNAYPYTLLLTFSDKI